MHSIHQITSGRATLATEVVGTGDPIVFLHAAICDRRMWREQLETVGATHQAIAYDRRGFGETHCEAEDYSAVEDLMTVIDTVARDKPAILVGCSQGGRVAIDAALTHPSRVCALVLISATVFGWPDPVYSPDLEAAMARLKEAEQARDLERVNAIKARLFLDGALAVEGRVQGAARELFFDMNGIALRAPPSGTNRDSVPAFQWLHEIAVPTFVIQGDLDFPHIQERSRYIAATIPNATHHELHGVAHVPSVEQPELVTKLISEFVQQLSN
ncbi:MAG: alpha/beta fold hydrolase [Casimicrobium sp.]